MTIPEEVREAAIRKWQRGLVACMAGSSQYKTWWLDKGKMPCAFCFYYKHCCLCPIYHNLPNSQADCCREFEAVKLASIDVIIGKEAPDLESLLTAMIIKLETVTP